MSEEILINVTPVETRVALVENGMLQEAYIERTSRKGIVGNIYKGKVVRVLPGMEAAFVDIGLERAAFIHASDVVTSQQPASDAPRHRKRFRISAPCSEKGSPRGSGHQGPHWNQGCTADHPAIHPLALSGIHAWRPSCWYFPAN